MDFEAKPFASLWYTIFTVQHLILMINAWINLLCALLFNDKSLHTKNLTKNSWKSNYVFQVGLDLRKDKKFWRILVLETEQPPQKTENGKFSFCFIFSIKVSETPHHLNPLKRAVIFSVWYH